MNAYERGDSRGTWFVLAEGTIDEAQATGRWLKTTEPVEIEQ